MSSLAEGRFVAEGAQMRPTKLRARHHRVLSSLIIVWRHARTPTSRQYVFPVNFNHWHFIPSAKQAARRYFGSVWNLKTLRWKILMLRTGKGRCSDKNNIRKWLAGLLLRWMCSGESGGYSTGGRLAVGIGRLQNMLNNYGEFASQIHGNTRKMILGPEARGGGRAFASETVSRWTTSHPIVRFNSIFPWLCKLYVNTKLRSFRSFASFSRVNYQSHAYMGKNNAKGFRNIACGNRRKSSSRLAAGWLARSAADVDLWSFEGSREKDRKRIPKSYEIHLLLVLRPQLHTNWNIPVNTTKILPNHSLRLSDDTITWPS